MSKRLTATDRAVKRIDDKIAVLQLAKTELLAAAVTLAKPRKPNPLRAATDGKS